MASFDYITRLLPYENATIPNFGVICYRPVQSLGLRSLDHSVSFCAFALSFLSASRLRHLLALLETTQVANMQRMYL